MMSSAWAIALIALAVLGGLAWFARSQRRSAILAFREAEIRQIAKIHAEVKKIDERTEKILGQVNDATADPRAMWLRDKKRVPDAPDPGASGNQV